MKRNIKTMLSLSVFALTLSMSSCVGDLDVKPIDPNLNTTVNPQALFNKCFANLGISGNGSSDDNCDVDGIDGGTSGFIRQLFNANELPTDEAICCWATLVSLVLPVILMMVPTLCLKVSIIVSTSV